MKESRLYFQFFHSNIWLIFSPAVVLSLMTFIYVWQLPPAEHYSQLLSMDYTLENVQSQIQLTDQAVSLLRESSVQQMLGINSSPVIYKAGPVLLAIDIKDNKEPTKSLETLSSFAESRFPVKKEGAIFHSYETPQWTGIIALTFVVGLGLGTLLSLIKTYGKNY